MDCGEARQAAEKLVGGYCWDPGVSWCLLGSRGYQWHWEKEVDLGYNLQVMFTGLAHWPERSGKEESRVTPECAGWTSVWMLLLNEEQWRVLLLGAPRRRPCWVEKKTEFYSEEVSFEVSTRHPSRDIKKNVIIWFWSWVRRKVPDTNSDAISIEKIFKAKDGIVS